MQLDARGESRVAAHESSRALQRTVSEVQREPSRERRLSSGHGWGGFQTISLSLPALPQRTFGPFFESPNGGQKSL